MISTLKVGIIGTGVGLRTHYPGFKKTNKVDFIGLVGSTYERAKEFASKYEFKYVFKTYKDLIESPEIDFVCITSPNNFHLDEILYALDQGKHILSEKPLASSMEEINKILNHPAQESGKLRLVDHQLRFNPYIVKVKEIIDQGKIGRPYYVRIHQQSTGFSDVNAEWVWSFDETQGGGVRLAMASHLIDLINFWFDGRKPLLVKGAMDSVVDSRKDGQGMPRKILTSSFFSSSISFDNYLDVHLSATAAAIGSSEFDFSIYGTAGELHFDLQNKLKGSFIEKRGIVEKIEVEGVTIEERENKVSIFSGSFSYLADKIVKHIIAEDRFALKAASTFKDAVYTQTLLDAIQESSTNGSLFKLNEGYKCNSKV